MSDVRHKAIKLWELMVLGALNFNISSKRELNAIYFGLLLSGYEYAAINKPKEINDIIHKIENYNALNNTRDFFSLAKSNTCEVYPFWPRAALLETALFFMTHGMLDIEKYSKYVNNRTNITAEERNNEFYEWIKAFPTHLHSVMEDKLFQEVDETLTTFTNAMEISESAMKLTDKLSSFSLPTDKEIKKLSVIICPIKCCYSADYFTSGSEMFVILGDYLPHSVVHEYLHLVVYPLIQKHKAQILSLHKNKRFEIDPSYYMSSDETGILNAYEEHIVRVASEIIANDQNIDMEHLVKHGKLLGGQTT